MAKLGTTLTEIVNGASSKKQAKQIAALVDVVTRARAEYGNTDADMDTKIMVNTCDGILPLSSLSAGDKLAQVNRQIAYIRQSVAEIEHFLTGKVSKKTLKRVLGEAQAAAIATNSILVNIDSNTDSKYL